MVPYRVIARLSDLCIKKACTVPETHQALNNCYILVIKPPSQSIFALPCHSSPLLYVATFIYSLLLSTSFPDDSVVKICLPTQETRV